MTAVYISSKGEAMQIASMPYPYLCSALAKLERDQPGRADEIQAMRDEVAKRDLEHAEATANGSNMPPESVERVRPAPIDPPTDEGFEAVKVHVEDLLLEARNWADGVIVETADQAEAVDSLIDQIRQSEKLAERWRVAAKKPLDDQIAVIQDKFNAYFAPLKNKKPGAASLAINALLKTVEPYRLKVLREKEEAARKLRDEAIAKQLAAQQAAQAANQASIDEREAVEAKIKEAAQITRQATSAAKSLNVGTGLRTYFIPEITDYFAALEHYSANRSDEFEALILKLAKQDIDQGKRQLPGVNVKEDQRAA